MRLSEPQPFPKEIPRLYPKIIRSAIGDFAEDLEVAQKIMIMPDDVFKLLYASFLQEEIAAPASRLRLV